MLIFEATSALRKEQDAQLRLHDRMDDQKRGIEIGDKRLQQLRRRQKTLNFMMATTDEESVNAVLEDIQQELSTMTMIVRSELFNERNGLQRRLGELENEKH